MKKQNATAALDGRQALLPNYGRNKLLTYADSFRELAETFEDMPGSEDTPEWDRQTYLWKKKMKDNCGLMAGQLNEVANIMAEVAEETFQWESLGEKKSKNIVHSLQAEGILIQEIYRIKNKDDYHEYVLWAKRQGRKEKSIEEIANMLSVMLNCRLVPAEGCPGVLSDKFEMFRLVEESRYHVLTGVALAVKETEQVSGDNYSVYQNDKGKLTMILSDGMGSGEKACEDSRLVVELMEKLLDTGFRPEMAIEMINNSILIGSEEQNMSSLDMCQIDLRTGMCEIYKIGGAGTFIKREHLVDQITARNLPLGIFQDIQTEAIERQLMDGDYIFMFSDGVADGLEEGLGEEGLAEIIGKMNLENPKEMANTILNYVIRESRGRIRDDMTVIVVGLWENML